MKPSRPTATGALLSVIPAKAGTHPHLPTPPNRFTGHVPE